MGDGGSMALKCDAMYLYDGVMASEAVWPSEMVCTKTILRLMDS